MDIRLILQEINRIKKNTETNKTGTNKKTFVASHKCPAREHASNNNKKAQESKNDCNQK